MAFTKRNKAAVKALVSCHETGKPVANYSAIVVLNDDAGITFGAHQATHKSGSLYKIVKMYCDVSDSALSKKLDPYVAGFKNPALRHKYAANKELKKLLVSAGVEPAMRYAQDKVFEINYLEPAIQAVLGSGWSHPLTLAVVYDAMIQGGWTKCRDRVSASDEKAWVKKFVAVRRAWLSSSKRQVVRNSVYRMGTFEKLLANNNWELDTPFIVHGVKVTDEHLAVWIAADNPHRDITESGDAEEINVEAPAPNFFVGNTEGIAEDDEAGGSWDEGVDVVPDSEPVTDSPSDVVADAPAVVETTAPAPESVVGGRPEDKPAEVVQQETVTQQGWRTWPTTVAATLGSLGLSVGGIFTSVSGIELTPTMQSLLGWVILGGFIAAAIYGMIYLVTRMINRNRADQRAHEIALKELELRSMPDRYNVKLAKPE